MTTEEKLTVTATDLSKALRSKISILLPDGPLRSNIDNLCDVLNATVQEIIIKNPKPLLKESKEILNAYAPASSPGVDNTPNVPSNNNSPKVECSTKLQDFQSSRLKLHKEPSLPTTQHIYRHSTLL